MLIATNDFFTPVVDDPYDYGFIAAANSLSDVYAMGGKPILALSIVALPLSLPTEISTSIMHGLGMAVKGAGAVIAGGHSVQDDEPKVGLCVIALAHPDQLLMKGGAKIGDVLALTKPLGNGIIATAAKAELADEAHVASAVDWMKRLNRSASEVAVNLGLGAATDITGFGLLGHSWEMASGAGVGVRFFMNDLPFLQGVREYADQWLFAAGGATNLENYESHARFDSDVTEDERMLLADPQTSGGLLLAIPRDQLDEFQTQMSGAGQSCWVIGEVIEEEGIFVHRERS